MPWARTTRHVGGTTSSDGVALTVEVEFALQLGGSGRTGGEELSSELKTVADCRLMTTVKVVVEGGTV